MAVRIVVAIDVDATDVATAYAMLVTALRPLAFLHSWETTDEWYDTCGEPIPVDEIERITLAHYGIEAPVTGK